MHSPLAVIVLAPLWLIKEDWRCSGAFSAGLLIFALLLWSKLPLWLALVLITPYGLAAGFVASLLLLEWFMKWFIEVGKGADD